MWDLGHSDMGVPGSGKFLLCNNPISLQWRHTCTGHDGFSNHQPNDCLLKRLFSRRSKETSKLRVTGLCEGNSPVTGEFPAQRASNVENVSIWWRHHDYLDMSHGLKQLITEKTRMWYMISSPARPTVCLQQKSENFQSRKVTSSMPSSSQILLYFTWFVMLLITLQANLNFQFNNHPIWPPNAASCHLGNWKWNRILVAVATQL